jgi:Flp pilus assembly pilin Flp
MNHHSSPKATVYQRIFRTYRMDWEIGQGLTEYAIIIALVAVVVIVIAAVFGSAVKQALCEPLIAFDPEYTLYCLAEPDIPTSPEEEGHSISGRARYSSYRDSLYIAARIPEGTSATLTVEGYGEMEYVPYRDAYRLVIHTHDPPSTVTIISSEGSSITIDVTRRW